MTGTDDFDLEDYEPPSSRPGGPPPWGDDWHVLLPVSLTLSNALCGFAAIALLALPAGTHVLGLQPAVAACIAILLGWGFDMVDGLAARLTGTSGPFGAQLDSLSDAASFGLAPAALTFAMWRQAVSPGVGIEGWVGYALGYMAGAVLLCGVLIRLARYNVEDVKNRPGQQDPKGHLYFLGLPSPVTGILMACLGWVVVDLQLGATGWGGGRFGGWLAEPLAGMIGLSLEGLRPAATQVFGTLFGAAPFLLGILMLTRFRYPDLPKHYLRGLQPRWHLAALAAAVLVFPLNWVMALFFLGYVVVFPLQQGLREARSS